ncbi:MAG: glutathione S-transferase family protein [Proteobacteria bacterium]|nr:glutathione S-transferase family protein [Pseudomonadota bacterium]
MKLYSNPLSPNCRKVHATLAHVGLEVEQQLVDVMKGEQRTPEFLAINPNGKVPALVDGAFNLWESNVIACYLAGKANSDLWPANQERYSILRWLNWEAAHLSQAVGTVIGEKIFKPLRGAEPDPSVVEQGTGDFRKLATVLSGVLESGGFLAGASPTVADYSVAVWFSYDEPCGLPTREYRHVTRWLDQVRGLPGGPSLAAPPIPS